jgi:hypothetical protein
MQFIFDSICIVNIQFRADLCVPRDQIHKQRVKNLIPKESLKRQIKNVACLIETVRGRYWKVQATVHAPLHRLKQYFTFYLK